MEELEVLEIEEIDYSRVVKTYDFEVEDNHNFFTNGILTHNCVDEVDVIQNPQALREGKMIPCFYTNSTGETFFPLTIYLSTRKFAGGLMEKTLKETIESGGEILRWNILDVTERITKEEAKVNEPKVTRYISRELPMENLSPGEWEDLADEEQVKYEKFEAYAGIANHPLLSVMKNVLVDRPQTDVGDLYKPITVVRNNFKQIPPDMGEAQLLCNKPSSSGLVYPRFEEDKNVLSISEALTRLKGEECNIDNFGYLQQYILNLGVPIVGGGDWGFTDHTALGILVLIPNGEIWLVDTMAMPGLELDDIVKYCTEFQNTWQVDKWYVDQNYPAYIKTLKKNGLKIPKFTKVVEDGIAALQGKIVNSNNNRKFYILDTPNNKPVIDAFGEYRWAIDGKGDIIEGKPFHDKDGVSDIMDMLRYPFQNLYSKLSKMIFTTSKEKVNNVEIAVQNANENKAVVRKVNNTIMQEKVNELATGAATSTKVRKKGRIMWG